MLDLTKLATQIPGISQHLIQETTENKKRLEQAQETLKTAQINQPELLKKANIWQNRLLFKPGIPEESLDTYIDINSAPASHTVIATDGSQIAPSHHEIAYCYLINVGRVMLHYGQSLHPFLDSLPEVFYKPEDIYVARQWGIRVEEWMGYRRTVSEAIILAELAVNWVKDAEENFRSNVPILTMVDGSLIYWFLETLPLEARDLILLPILASWDKLRLANIPIMGYLSATRSIESLSFLRLQACPHPAPDCMSYCSNLEKKPCQLFESLRDSVLWASQLQPGQRSPLWRSNANILDQYKDHQIYFCYVHVGTEIARIEVPAWVAENKTLFDQSLSLMLAQVQKGYGYPVALAEAHNQAVVRSSDRTHFFIMLEQQMIKAGIKNVGISYKETRKRGSVA